MFNHLMNAQELLSKNNNIVLLPIKDLIPYAKNNKDHNDEQINELAGMIAAWKKVDPIRLDKNKVIIAGHGRLLALAKLGYTEVPCIIDDDLDEYQTMALRIAHNKIADKATYNIENISFDVGTLDRNGFNLDLLGLTKEEMQKIMNFSLVEVINDQAEKKTQKACPNCGHLL